ncbi:hypothetical protein Trydic_g20793 [Trypoxylus dichotomus]
MNEVKDSIPTMKGNKSLGINNIPMEAIQYAGEELLTKIYKLIDNIWVKDEIPSEWDTAVGETCRENGPTMDAGEGLQQNYRGKRETRTPKDPVAGQHREGCLVWGTGK